MKYNQIPKPVNLGANISEKVMFGGLGYLIGDLVMRTGPHHEFAVHTKDYIAVGASAVGGCLVAAFAGGPESFIGEIGARADERRRER